MVNKNGVLSIAIVMLLLASTQAAHSQAAGDSNSVQKTINLGECAFNLNDPYSGNITINPGSFSSHAHYHADLHIKTVPGAVNIDFSCAKESIAKTCQDKLGIIKNGQGQWALAPAAPGDQPENSDPKVFALQSRNGAGGAIESNDMTGDPDERGRNLSFCLGKNDDHVIYGFTYVDSLTSSKKFGPHKSIEPQVLGILNSIEFIEAPFADPNKSPSEPSH